MLDLRTWKVRAGIIERMTTSTMQSHSPRRVFVACLPGRRVRATACRKSATAGSAWRPVAWRCRCWPASAASRIACPTPVTIVGARSPAFGDVSLHDTTIVDGISRMRAVPELPIAADEAAMLQARRPAPDADAAGVAVEGRRARSRSIFRLQDGREVRGEFVVRKRGGISGVPLRRRSRPRARRPASGVGCPAACRSTPSRRCRRHRASVSSSRSRMRWPIVRLVLPSRSTNSSTTISSGHAIGRR